MKPTRIPRVTAQWTHEAAHEGRARLEYQKQKPRMCTSCHPMPGSHHLFRRGLSLDVLGGCADTVDEVRVMTSYQALWMSCT